MGPADHSSSNFPFWHPVQGRLGALAISNPRARPANLLPHRWKASPPAYAHTSHRVGEGPTLGETRTRTLGRGRRLPVSVSRGGVPAGSIFKTLIIKESWVDRAEILHLLLMLMLCHGFLRSARQIPADRQKLPSPSLLTSQMRDMRPVALPCFFKLCDRGERWRYDRQRRDI